MSAAIPGYRHALRHGWYVPTVNGKDLPVTTFCEVRALKLATEAAAKMNTPTA